MSTVLVVAVVLFLCGIVPLFGYTLTTLGKSSSRLERAVDRMEAATAVVAKDLKVAQTAVDWVAVDLAESRQRADGIADGQPGEAADAGAQSEKIS